MALPSAESSQDHRLSQRALARLLQALEPPLCRQARKIEDVRWRTDHIFDLGKPNPEDASGRNYVDGLASAIYKLKQ
jgi:hypothetical protein